MRALIRHQITQRFEPGTRSVISTARVTPRGCDGQFVVRWGLHLSEDCRLIPQEDAFGNLCHTFTLDGPVTEVTLIAEGELDTQDTAGIIRGTVERFPPSLYMRQTDLTQPDETVDALAAHAAKESDPLSQLHALMGMLHGEVREIDEPPGTAPRTAAATLEAGAACSGGITHAFTSAARLLGIPARHISGYLADGEDMAVRHWAEAYAPKIGWVAFDCGRKLCATESHIRLAVGLDAIGVSPLRSTNGLAQEQVVRGTDPFATAIRQSQSQSQS